MRRVYPFVFVFLCWFNLSLSAREASQWLTETKIFPVDAKIGALAISTDEALIAVATSSGENTSAIQIFDRLSRKRLTQIATADKDIVEMVFSKDNSDLAILTGKAVEVWDLSKFSSGSEPVLSKSHLLIEEALQETAGAVGFINQSKELVWTDGKKIIKKNLRRKDSSSQEIWQDNSGAESIQALSFDPNGDWLAFAGRGQNQIQIVDPATRQIKPALDYHLFPVSSLQYLQSNTILSLDTEQNLVWGHVGKRVKINGANLMGMQDNQATLKVTPIFQDEILALIVRDTKGQTTANIIQKSGILLEKLNLVGADAFAVSPTGAYLLSSSEPNEVQLHKFANHVIPEDYLRQLLDRGASELARRYRNSLEKLPPQLSTLTSSTEEESGSLQPLLKSLRSALAAQQWSEVNAFIEKILKLDPKSAEALDAQKKLAEHQDQNLLQQGKEALAAEKYDQAVRLLAQIPKESSLREEARNLIENAELKLQMALKLSKVEQELKLNNWARAEAVLISVLDQDPQNIKALALREQIQEHNTIAKFWNTLSVLILAAAIGIIGLLAFKKREFVIRWLSMQEEQPNLKPRSPSTGGLGGDEITLEEKRFREIISGAEDLLKQCYAKDFERKFDERLQHFDQELQQIRQKSQARKADFKTLHAQVLTIIGTLRSFNLTSRPDPQFSSEHKRGEAGRKGAPDFEAFRNSKDSSTKDDPTQQKQKEFKRDDYTKTDSKQQSSTGNPVPPVKDFYAALGVNNKATASEIKQAYHQQLKEFHPDRHHNTEFNWIKEEAEARTILIREAFDTLSDPKRRSAYDAKLK